MAQVIYDGNGADGGQAPVDSNTYSAGDPVNDGVNDTTKAPYQQTDSSGNSLGIVTGNLTKTGATFLYWNTEPNGGSSGTIHGWPADTSFTFPAQTTNLTLYAQWAITDGLMGGGVTANYAFSYDASLQQTAANPTGLEPARTNAVIASCDTDFSWMAGLFPNTVNISTVTSLPITVYVTALSGGANTTAQIRARPGNAPAEWIRCLLVAEVTEIFMHAQHTGWGYAGGVSNEQSCGEALSLFLTEQFQLHIGATLTSNNCSDTWLNSALPTSNNASTRYYDKTSTSQGYDYGSRVDYVNSTLNWPGNGPGTGCSMLFLYYLYHQLGFSIPDIIANAPGFNASGQPNDGACLRGVYQNLTGDSSDPFPFFAQLLANAYPPDQVATIPGSNPDDPWPLGSLSFAGAKNRWGHDEINDIIATGGVWPDAFYLMLEGFSQNIVGSTLPSVPTIAFTGATTSLDTSPTGGILYDTTNPKVPQRIRFPYNVNFAKPLGAFPPSGETPAAVDTSIPILGQSFPATTEFFFLAGADPYFTNVQADPAHPKDVNVPWLSEDLRVFTATPGAPPASQYQYPVPGGPQFIEHSVGGNFDVQGAYTYLQNLLLHLNQTYGDPTGQDPFDPSQNVIPSQSGAYTGDSSVTPYTQVGGQNYNNYSFAIARVRLRGSAGPSGAATGVRVFFRLWQTQTADTDWQPASTYLSHNDPTSGSPLWPEAPPDDHTIPFFATNNTPNFTDPMDPEFGTTGFTNTGVNNLTITINQGDSQWSYFGCFLNVNDPTFVVNGLEIPTSLAGTHHCLVAQIAYPGALIQNVGSAIETPENSGQLAQRNLQVTTSDNPGPPSTHRIPQTFDVRPSPVAYDGTRATYPDELMIDWGDTPVGSVASIYWPQVNSADVLALAARMYGTHPLSAADGHTLRCRTIKGLTYVPIPHQAGDSFAGLFTVDLPQTVVKGQEFDIVVRRIGTRRLVTPPPAPPPPPTPQIEIAPPRRESAKQAPTKDVAVDRPQAVERYIIGSFQVKIPVATRDEMLPAEETTLAILKARLAAMSKTNRWYPVLLRYIGQVSDRVDGLGGTAAAIPPSLKGYQPVRRSRDHDLAEYTGKVCEVIFDCFGDFIGFVLEDCCERHAFESREKEIGQLALRALKERLTLSVFVAPAERRRIVRLIVRG
jgi:hypothetical protein